MRYIDDKLIEPAVVVRNGGAALDRQRMHAVHAKAALDHMRRGGLGGGEVARLHFEVEQDVIAPFVVDEWRLFPQRIRHGDDRRQRLEFHLDAGGEILGFARGRGEHHRDRLADMAHLSGGQDRPIRRLEAGQFRGRAHAADTGKVAGMKDALLRALRFAHRDDTRMGVRRAHEGRVQHPGQINVGAELAAPLQEARVLEPGQPRADTEFASHRSPQRAICSAGYPATSGLT